MNSNTISSKAPNSSFLNSSHDSILAKLARNIQSFLTLVLQSLMGNEGPRIQSRLAHNRVVFDAYDPVNNRYMHNASEEELRIWLENRYYTDHQSF